MNDKTEKLISLYKKNKEVLLYVVFGVLTTLISIIIYWICNVCLSINELVANIISWIIAVLFAFVTNRIWVFEAPTKGIRQFFGQMISFYGGRVFTLLVEELLLFIFITKLGLDSMLVKTTAQIVIIVLNYVISKVFVFKK